MKVNCISIIGGDLRIVKLAQMLTQDYIVYTYGLEESVEIVKNSKIISCDSMEEAIDQSDIVISSIPLSSDKKTVNTPFSKKMIMMTEMISHMKHKIFIAGNIPEEMYALCKDKEIQVVDILKREELTVLNTIATAEGALEIAIRETSKTVHDSKVLILGFGRVGKVLANTFQGIGARVYCEARKQADLAWIQAYHYEKIEWKHLEEELEKFDIIINTIPAMVLEKDQLKMIKSQTVLIDLASNPGGIDREAAKKLGIKVIWALSLPGKVAPITSAEYIKDTLYHVIEEIKE